MRVALAITALALALAPPALASVQARHFALSVGQTRTFPSAKAGDHITCHGGRYSLTVVVSSRHEALFRQRTITPTRRLAINLGRNTHRRVWVLCRWR
jgi:hypothetical protein